ncbi:MAG: GvpL/GvpF family gas vesicle protein [bacterium]
MATTTHPVNVGFYLYGITLADNAPPVDVEGVENTPVDQIVQGAVSAIVTRVTSEKIRPRRSNLTAHHQVLRDLTERATILPVAFGTIADSESRLREVIENNQDLLVQQLQWLEGKVELGLNVYWDTPNIFEYFVATHEELARLRDRIFRPGRTPTFDEKVQMGRLFETLLQESRRRHTKQVTRALSPYCADIRGIDAGGEKMIMKLACLVNTNRQREWQERIETLACHFDNHYCFKCTGPWAPYNFVDVDLSLASA